MKRKIVIRNGKCAGASMLEVLITLVIIGVGLLGLAGMQVVSLGNAGAARVNSLAAMLTQSLAASIDANQAYWGGTNAGAPSGFKPLPKVEVSGATLTPSIGTASVDCEEHSCDPREMAGYDLRKWGEGLAKYLPNGTGKVECSEAPRTAGLAETTPQYLCVITVSWLEKQLKSATDNHSNLKKSESRTYTLVVQQ